MRPVICMITAPLDPGDRGAKGLVARVGAAARAGVHLIQVRQPHLEGRALHALVQQARSVVEGTGARIVVNDRVDVAIEARAHGVHLRGDSMPGRRVRAAAPPPLLIGRSVHSLDEAQRVADEQVLDYLIFGSVFAPYSKAAGRVAGVEQLEAVCRRVALPVLAVGGMRVDRLGAIARAGAAGFAAIGLFANTPLDALETVVADAARTFTVRRSEP